MPVMSDWSHWRARRPATDMLHLDTAAAGRQSVAVLAATAAHARLEAEVGAYVAQARAADVLDGLRGDLAGLLGVPADGVAFTESATAALAALLGAWRFPEGATVGVVPAEWGPNLELLAWHGLRPVPLDADDTGRIDLDALARRLRDDPPSLVHLTQVTSHRALIQPAAEAAALCRGTGVPLWVDAAQALGHVDVACDADAVYAPGRKWLAGPRGIGIVAVAERNWGELAVPRPEMVGDLPVVQLLESRETHVAGRVGLAAAVREYLADGPAAVHARLDEVGRATRAALAEVPGWALAGPPGAPGAITAIRPTAGQDVATVRARLLDEHAIVTTTAGPARAPWEMTEPLLRVSPHVDCTPGDLERLASPLAAIA